MGALTTAPAARPAASAAGEPARRAARWPARSPARRSLWWPFVAVSVAGLWTAHVVWSSLDWRLLSGGGRAMLGSAGLHTFARDPVLQAGPVSLLAVRLLDLATPADGLAVAHWAMALVPAVSCWCAVLLIRAVPFGALRCRCAELRVVPVWAGLAARWRRPGITSRSCRTPRCGGPGCTASHRDGFGRWKWPAAAFVDQGAHPVPQLLAAGRTATLLVLAASYLLRVNSGPPHDEEYGNCVADVDADRRTALCATHFERGLATPTASR